MKRLFYATADIDDVEEISDEVHASGIDDHHFYVINRNKKEIKKHHLHGGTSLEKTSLMGGRRKSGMIAGVVLGVAIGMLAISSGLFGDAGVVPIALLLVLSALIVFVASMVGISFDNYFLGVFNRHIDAGETLVIIDVESSQADKVKQVMDHHPKAHFLADCFSYGAPIPD